MKIPKPVIVYAYSWVGTMSCIGTYKGYEISKSTYWINNIESYTNQEKFGEYFGQSLVCVAGGIIGGMVGLSTLFMPQVFVLYDLFPQYKNKSNEKQKHNMFDTIIGTPK